MKINKFLTLIAILVIFFLGMILGFNLKNSTQDIRPIDINSSPKSCQYNGKAYKSGEGFPSSDGCNSCSCVDGEVACTLMACDQ